MGLNGAAAAPAPRAWLLALAMLLACTADAADEFQSAVEALNARSFDDKTAAATALVRQTHPRTAAVLTALLEGRLHNQRTSNRIVIAEKVEAGYAIRDAATGEDLGEVNRRAVRRISINNQLRRLLRGLIAQLRLDDPDPAQRIAAVQAIADAGDQDTRPALESLRAGEEDDDVITAIDTALAIFDLDAPDAGRRLAAIDALKGNLNANVRTKLTNLASDESVDEGIRATAREALKNIEDIVARYQFIETVFFGLSLGSILVLAAIGLSITFGVMGVINMAHGELIMLGAYTTYIVQVLFPDAIEISVFIAIPLAFLVSGLVGVAIERGVIRLLYGRPLETLLATFGVSLILQQAVRTFISPQNRPVSTPQWMSGSLEIAQGLSITYNRMYILIFAALVFAALVMVLQHTRLGLEVRAVTQNRAMARAMGIRSDRVDALTFGLGAGIAGVAGVALSQITNVGPNLGQGYIVDSFMVVVFGGVGNVWGTLVAGLSLGIANKFLEPVAGAVVAKILVLVFIILFIQKRPRGLFPQRGRAAEA